MAFVNPRFPDYVVPFRGRVLLDGDAKANAINSIHSLSVQDMSVCYCVARYNVQRLSYLKTHHMLGTTV